MSRRKAPESRGSNKDMSALLTETGVSGGQTGSPKTQQNPDFQPSKYLLSFTNIKYASLRGNYKCLGNCLGIFLYLAHSKKTEICSTKLPGASARIAIQCDVQAHLSMDFIAEIVDTQKS